jgi:hypothetical protein
MFSKGLAAGSAALRAAPWRSKDINLTTYAWLQESWAVDEFKVNSMLMRADRLFRLLARYGHGGAVTACLLSGAKRKASTRDEYFAF